MSETYVVVAVALCIVYGFVIGQNDAANSFGPWIGAKIGKIRTGMILCAVFAIIGATLEGGKVIHTIGGGIVPAGYLTREVAVIGIIASVIWVFIASVLGLPISTTHAAVGSIGGIGAALIMFGRMPTADFNSGVIVNIVICWFFTPLASMVLALGLSLLMHRAIQKYGGSLFVDRVSRYLLTVTSCYVAYCWGANDVANSVALLVGAKIMSVKEACMLGGCAIGLGAIILGHRVAETVGFEITRLSPPMGVIADIATALTIHLFTRMGIPVSTTHALVGAVVGGGLARSVNIVNFKIVKEIVFAWAMTPVLTFILTFLVYIIFHFIAG